ncbi:MAG TPA: ribokinase [Mycobacterium sp.]|nr:ribokinase [Mycobacterium sp.]
MARVCVVGSVNMDLGFVLASGTPLPRPGETVLASTLTTSPGGKGGNQAVAAARAGAQVQLVAALGADTHGRALRQHLTSNGVKVQAVATLPVPSGTAAIVVRPDTAENMIVVAPGANAHLTLDDPLARDTVSGSDVVLLQLEIPVDTALAAAQCGRDAGVTVLLNASPAGADTERLAKLATLVDVVIVNETEAADWRWPVPHLVTTLGARGASYDGEYGHADISAPAVEPIDTTGAGDVFAGVLAAGWRDDHRHALLRAVTAGALATLVPGAGDCAPRDETIEDALADG